MCAKSITDGVVYYQPESWSEYRTLLYTLQDDRNISISIFGAGKMLV
jgi:hypothetical protein